MSSWTLKTGNAALTENNVFTGTNTFQGTTILTGPVNVSGDATFNGSMVVNGSATFTSAVTFTGSTLKEKRTTVSVSATYAVNPSGGHYVDLILVDNCTITASATLSSSQEQEVVMKITQDGTGGRTLAWAGVTWDTGVAPTMPTAAGATLSVTLVCTSSEIRGFAGFQSSDNLTANNITSTGTLTTTGVARAVRVVTVSGDVTVTALDHVVVVNKTFTEATKATLPAGVLGKEFIIKDGAGNVSAANLLTVTAAQNIDGSTASIINNGYGSKRYVFNGTQYNVIGAA